MFPNPAKEKITINELPKNTLEIIVVNTEGKQVVKAKTAEIDISFLPAGIYQAQIKTERETINRRFIKE